MSILLDSELIRRGDLEPQLSPSERGSPDTTLKTHFQEQLEKLYGRVGQGQNDTQTIPVEASGLVSVVPSLGKSEEVYDFRLFARSVKAVPSIDGTQSLQRIALRSPAPINDEPGFIHSCRPKAYYFTGPSNQKQAEQFRQAAISGEQVVASLKTRWPGSELPWRVTVIKAKKSARSRSSDPAEQHTSKKRKRSGKKKRIALRNKVKAQSAKELASQQIQVEKEAAEREKRTRRNREKKVKKKQKEKSKKLQELQDSA